MLAARVVLCASMLFGLGATAHAAVHSHVRVVIEVRADDTGPTGDVMGLYAVELVACAVPLGRAAQPVPAHTSLTQRVVESVFAAISGTAQANHRDRFDGLAAREFMQLVALDRASRDVLGELDVSAAEYCQLRLTLARFPSTATRAALTHGLRLCGSTGACWRSITAKR